MAEPLVDPTQFDQEKRHPLPEPKSLGDEEIWRKSEWAGDLVKRPDRPIDAYVMSKVEQGHLVRPEETEWSVDEIDDSLAWCAGWYIDVGQEVKALIALNERKRLAG